MAERVDRMPSPRRGAPARYPWGEWFDGSIWELVQGKDFECKTKSMWSCVQRAADSRHITVQIVMKGDHLYVQAQR